MRMVVLDLEFENQTQRDIIQVGAVTVDLLRGKIEPFFNEYVSLPPGVPLTSYISDLTGITQTDVATARSAEEVFSAFWTLFDDARVVGRLAGWGDDAEWLVQESVRYGVEVPQNLDKIDLKQLFQFFRFQHHFSTRKKTGLMNTLHTFGLQFEGRHHNAYDDALNTARLLLRGVKNPG